MTESIITAAVGRILTVFLLWVIQLLPSPNICRTRRCRRRPAARASSFGEFWATAKMDANGPNLLPAYLCNSNMSGYGGIRHTFAIFRFLDARLCCLLLGAVAPSYPGTGGTRQRCLLWLLKFARPCLQQGMKFLP